MTQRRLSGLREATCTPTSRDGCNRLEIYWDPFASCQRRACQCSLKTLAVYLQNTRSVATASRVSLYRLPEFKAVRILGISPHSLAILALDPLTAHHVPWPPMLLNDVLSSLGKRDPKKARPFLRFAMQCRRPLSLRTSLFGPARGDHGCVQLSHSKYCLSPAFGFFSNIHSSTRYPERR